ncbi:MAG: hypothetical protein ACO3RX_09640, partial [Chthoniobacterales bacterium]
MKAAPFTNRFSLVVSLTCLLFYSRPLWATDVSWVATTNNANWTNTNNWSGGVLPGAADNVFLTNGFQTW